MYLADYQTIISLYNYCHVLRYECLKEKLFKLDVVLNAKTKTM